MIVGLVRFCVVIGCPIVGGVVFPMGGVLIGVCVLSVSSTAAVIRTVSLTCDCSPSFVALCCSMCVFCSLLVLRGCR